MSQILELLAFVVLAAGVLFALASLSQPLMKQQVMVLRLRRNMRNIEVQVVDWKRELGRPPR